MQELFRLCCFIGSRCFSHRVGAAANPNAFDVTPPLPPAVDLLNQALAVAAAPAAAAAAPAAAAATGDAREDFAAHSAAAAQPPTAPTAAAAAAAAVAPAEGIASSSSSSSSSNGEAALLQELRRRLVLQLQPPSLRAPCCIAEANKEIAKRKLLAAVASPTDPEEVAAVFGLAALLMQCADLKQLNRRSPLSALFLQTLTDELQGSLAQALSSAAPQGFISRYLLLSLFEWLPLRLFPGAAGPLRRLLLEELQRQQVLQSDRRTLRALGAALGAALATETAKLDAIMPPPNAGVFVSREREASGRVAHMKRLAFLLLAAPEGFFTAHVALLLERLTEALKPSYPAAVSVEITIQ
ncbi:dopey, N-terminal domain-containing protein, putative, partial [Eimeria tenella]